MSSSLQQSANATMSTLSLKISLEGGRVTKTIQFDPQTTIFDACKIIRDKFAEAVQGQRKYSRNANSNQNGFPNHPLDPIVSGVRHRCMTSVSNEIIVLRPILPQRPNMACSCPTRRRSRASGWRPAVFSATICCATRTCSSTGASCARCAFACWTVRSRRSWWTTRSRCRS